MHLHAGSHVKTNGCYLAVYSASFGFLASYVESISQIMLKANVLSLQL
jgi:hypothetical protein